MTSQSVLDKPIVLCLNKAWQAIGYKSVRDAITDLNSLDKEALKRGRYVKAAEAMVIDYPLIGEDTFDFEKILDIHPVSWEEWVELPIRPFDNVIRTAKIDPATGEHKLIRVPTVIKASKFDKMPMKEKRLSNGAIHERDGLTCQYSGKKLTRANATVDHVIPRDVWKREGRQGSPDRWDNLVTCEAGINHRKGNHLNEEIGLKLLRQPKAPAPLPMSALITEIRHRDWTHFLL